MDKKETELDCFIDKGISYNLLKGSQTEISKEDISIDISINIYLTATEKSYEALVLKIIILNDLERYEESKLLLDATLNFIQAILKFNSKDYIALTYYGIVINLYKMLDYNCEFKKLPSSRECFEKSLDIVYKLKEINKKDVEAIFFEGLNCSSLGIKRQAEEAFDLCVKINPKHYKGWMYAGIIKSKTIFSKIDLDIVLNCYKMASSISPNKMEAEIRSKIAIDTYKKENSWAYFSKLYKG